MLNFLSIAQILIIQIFGKNMEEFSKTFSTSGSRTRVESNWMSSPNHRITLRHSTAENLNSDAQSNPSQYSKLNSLTLSLYASLEQLRQQNKVINNQFENCTKNIQSQQSSLHNITAYSNLCSINSEIETELKNKINKKMSKLDQQIGEIFRCRTVQAKLYNKQMKQNIQQISALKDKCFEDLNKNKTRVFEPLRLQVALLKKQAVLFSKENAGFRSEIFSKLNGMRSRLQMQISEEERKRKSYNQIIHNLLQKSSEKAQQMLRRKL